MLTVDYKKLRIAGKGSYSRLYNSFTTDSTAQTNSAHELKALKSFKFVKTDSFEQGLLKWHWASVWYISMAPDPMCSIYNEICFVAEA